MDTLSQEHKNLIEQTTRNAFIFGLGLIKSCHEAFVDEGWTWTEEHERYLFEHVSNIRTKLADQEDAEWTTGW